jgi:predicted acetyltransferase
VPETELPIRPVGADELPAFFAMLSTAFGEDFNDDEFAVELLTAEPERTLAAFDREDIVGTAGAFTFELAVPGARLPAAGVTYVGVRPTHRRRGLLSRMMRDQLADVHRRGEPVAVLWASEAAIYGRFGYGVASQLQRIEIDRVDAMVRADVAENPALRLRLVDPGQFASDIESIELALVDRRPGQFVRDKRWIDTLVADPKSRHGSLSKLQGLLVYEGDEAVGYALYRSKNDSLRPHMLPDGEVLVFAQAALTPAADVALARTLLSMDLMRRIRWWNRPMDSALPHLLTDARQARATVIDGLHLRIVDLPTALAARRYATEVDVVLEVDDAICEWNTGRWHLRGDGASARCTRTDAEPTLRLGLEDLGAVYLGGTTLASLAAVGRVRAVDEDHLARTSTAFGWHTSPWCPVIF